MPVITAAPVVTVNGSALSAAAQAALVGLRVERALGMIGRATLRFADPGYTLASSSTFGVGTPVMVKQPGAATLFSGIVTGVGLEQAAGEHVELTVVADDNACKLSRGAKVQTYLNASYGDVVRRIAGAAGVSVRITDAPTTVNEFLIQTGGDLAYVDELVRRSGLVWTVDGGGTLVVCKPALGSSADTLTLGDDLTDFAVRASAMRPSAVTVTGWDRAQTQAVSGTDNGKHVGTSSSDFVRPYTVGRAPLGTAAASTAEWNPASADDAATIAGALYSSWVAQAVVARGTCDVNAKVAPGATITVANAGPSSGTYYVAEVEHVYRSSGFTTRFVAGPLRPGGLAESVRRPGADAGFTTSGLVLGVVTDVSDPDSLGRCKVRYVSVGAAIESGWARVLSLGGGAKRGVTFQPEVNDEVLVGFEHGDLRAPVVLGGLFSRKNALPTAGSGIVGQRVDFRRMTSRLGHVIEFGDGTAAADQHVKLELANGTHRIRLGADKLEVAVDSGKPVTVTAGSAKFEITAGGDVTIEGKNVTVKASAKLVLQGAESALEGTGKVDVKGKMVGVKADGIGQVEAGGALALKGKMVAIN